MSIFDTLVVSRRTPGVAQVTMSRPAVFNAFDEAMIAELDAAWHKLGTLPEHAAWSKALAFADAGGTVVVTGESQPEPLPKDWPASAGAETAAAVAASSVRTIFIYKSPIYATNMSVGTT